MFFNKIVKYEGVDFANSQCMSRDLYHRSQEGSRWYCITYSAFSNTEGEIILFDVCQSELKAEPVYEVTYSPVRTRLLVDVSAFDVEKQEISVDKPAANAKAGDNPTVNERYQGIIASYHLLQGIRWMTNRR